MFNQERVEEVAQAMYTHVNRCKNNKNNRRKFLKKENRIMKPVEIVLRRRGKSNQKYIEGD
jgi:hypothetical protein